MTERRRQILDAALHVLADRGMRGLTHRAVDEVAGIAAGSTSYYFRSRSALVTGCVERLVEIDVAQPAPVRGPGTGWLLDALVWAGTGMLTEGRRRTLARYELSLAAVRDPDLGAALVRGGDVIRRELADAIAGTGVPGPTATAAELVAVLDGLVLTALVRGPEDPAAIAAWMRPVLERALPAVRLGR